MWLVYKKANMYVLRPLFNKFQKELVAFANTQTGRDFISGFGGKELKENYPVVKVTPDSVHQQLDKKTFRAVFYSRSPYVGKFADALTMADIADRNNYSVKEEKKHLVIPHFLGETRLLKNEMPTIYLNSGTYYPDADPESTSIDGSVYYIGTNVNWATIRAAATGTGEESTSTAPWMGRAESSASSGNWYRLDRGFALFDTSTLTSSASISDAVLSFYGSSLTDNFALAAAIVSSSPASSNALVVADFDQVGTTRFASDLDLTSWSTAGYNDFTLNASGISAISKTSITKFGMRLDKDLDNSAPTWAGSTVGGAQLKSAETADTTSDPKLVVTYTLPGAFLAFM